VRLHNEMTLIGCKADPMFGGY